MTNSMLDTMLRCSADQADTLVSAYRDAQGWHVETVIAAAGALVGHAIQASAYSMATQGTGSVTEFERPTNPPFGKFINCGERIQIFIDNEFTFMKSVAEQLDWFAPQAVPDMQAIVAACIEQIGGDWFPRLSVAAEHLPREWSPDAVPRFTRAMRAHLDRHGLQQNVCEVLCLALAFGLLVRESKDRLDPAVSLRIGLEMAVSTANIGNLERPHVSSQFEEPYDGVSHRDAIKFASGEQPNSAEDVSVTVLDLDADAAANLRDEDFSEFTTDMHDFDEMPDKADVEADDNEAGSAEDEELPAPRSSRLSRERPKMTAFGKRQFA